MFVLDTSKHFIDAEEQDVIALYRSNSAVTAEPPEGKVQTYEAVVCAVGKEPGVTVYVTLLDTPARQMLVYLPEESGPYADRLKDALAFAESLGFSMESVNLNYSKALREVIIRNIRVFQPLQNLKKITQGKTAAAKKVDRQAAGDKSSVKKAESDKLADLHAREAEREKELEQLEQAELKRLLTEKAAAEVRAAEQARETMVAWENAEKERVEREQILAEMAAVKKRAEEHAEEARLARGKADAERLEREKILAEKAEAERRAAELAEAARLALERAEAERAELERVLAEKNEAEKRAAEREEAARLALEKAEVERIEREKALAEKIEAEKQAAEHEKLLVERAEAEKREARQAETVRVALEKAEAERTERERLLAEKAAAEKLAEEHAEAARRAIEQAEVERTERNRLLEEKNAAEKRAAEQAEAARIASARVRQKRAEREREHADKVAAEKLEAGNVEKMRLALERVETERAESERLLNEKTAAEQAAETDAHEAHSSLETASSERINTERDLGEKEAAEQQAAEYLDAARRAWERAESERVEQEQLLAGRVEAEQVAEKRLEATRASLQQAVNERRDQEVLLESLAAAVQKAAAAVETARLKQDRAEQERVESERLLAEETVEGVEPDKIPVEAGPVSEVAALKTDIPQDTVFNSRQPDTADGAPENVRPAGDLLLPRRDVIGRRPEPPEEHVPRFIWPHEAMREADPAPVETVATAVAREKPGEKKEPSGAVQGDASPFFNPFDSEPSVEFTLDESLDCIQIGEGKGVRELFCATNMSRVKMENFPAQNCAAFLCSLESNGDHFVYVAFYLGESNKVLVYTPGRQPGTVEECNEASREGIRFIETVGFIMDRVETDGKLEQLMASNPGLNRVLCQH